MKPSRSINQTVLATCGALVFAAMAKPISASTYYVSGTGNDVTGDGSVSNPWRNPQQAVRNGLNPGDTVIIGDGTYSELVQDPDFAFSGLRYHVLHLRNANSGTAGNPVTFKAASGATPIFDLGADHSTGVFLDGAQHVVIEGLTLKGNNDIATFSGAQSAINDNQINGTPLPALYANTGIFSANDFVGSNIYNPTNVTIRDNTVYDFGSNGIGLTGADEVLIEGNHVYENALYTNTGNSGIAMFGPSNHGTPGDTRIVIRDNVTHDNENLFAFVAAGYITDGNGIILDSFDDFGYDGRSLVENNISYNNGGAGINAFRTSGVDIINNTFYHNSLTPGLDKGEIAIGGPLSLGLDDYNILNNILYAVDGEDLNFSYNLGPNFNYKNNLFWDDDGSLTIAQLSNVGGPDVDTLMLDPMFADALNGDFSLLLGSGAIDAGLSGALIPSFDIDGTARPQGAGIDVGAYEFSNPIPEPASLALLAMGLAFISQGKRRTINQ